MSGAITREEQQLRLATGLVGLLSGAFIVIYVVTAVTSDSHYPFVANSLSKDALFAALAVIAVTNIRSYSFAVILLVGAHLALVAGMTLVLLFGAVSSIAGTLDASTLPLGIGPATLVWIWLGSDLGVAGGLGWLYARAQRARFDLQYLAGIEFTALMALAEVLTPDPAHRIEPYEVAKRADRYLYSFTAQGKSKIRLALLGLAIYPVFTLRAPFSMMSPEARVKFIDRYFLDDVSGHRLPAFLATLAQSMIRAAQQMAFLGFYEDPRAQERCDYRPFSERPGAAEKIKRVPPHRPLRCERQPDGDELAADVVVIGSGAGGAVLAYELASRDREVLILERGSHVDRSEFSEIESEQLSKLYADGALTLSRDFRFQVLQGMCVGGSTVVNNAVCFELPPEVLERWRNPSGLDAGLDAGQLGQSFAHLRKWLPVIPMKETDLLNPGWRKFDAGVKQLGLATPPHDYGLVSCNVLDCLGCGYCNIGCAYGKKLSMLDNVLPRAQQKWGEAVRVLADCRVERIEVRGGRAVAAHCRLADGRKLAVRANTIVLSAGAIGSSMILARSGVGGPLVGRNLGFNIATPLTADFEDELHSEQGIQISHYLSGPDDDGAVLETWFNPIVSQALFMPGWFHEHYANMLRYKHMTCIGSVIGSKRNATVKPARFGDGVSLRYTPDPDDLKRLRAGLKLAGEIMFAAGALRVMPASYRTITATDRGQLDQWDRLLSDDAVLSVNTAHPQGGNCLSRDRGKGVVDPGFKLWDLDNLFVCDASVFPSPITVNPQLTVMALAHYAAGPIASN